MIMYVSLLLCSLFYIFITHLTATIILLVAMCIANLYIEFEEISSENEDMSGPEIFGETLKKYWWSFIAAFIALVFSIFVFGLFGFHSYLVQNALTTQEKLKHMYDRFPISPFHHGRCFANWKKVVIWPAVAPTKLYHMLYLFHRNEPKYNRIVQQK